MKTVTFGGLALALLLSACSTNDGGGAGGGDDDDGGSGVGSGSGTGSGSGSSGGGAATCEGFAIEMTSGHAVNITSNSMNGGNPQRDYCFVMPTGKTTVKLHTEGGDCFTGECIHNDLHLFLKRGDVPDAFHPDSETKHWTYTPAVGGVGTYGKGGMPGAWYLGLRDDANSLGYSDVSLEVVFE